MTGPAFLRRLLGTMAFLLLLAGCETESPWVELPLEAVETFAEGRLPPAVVGTPYEARFEAQGGYLPYRFSVTSGELPPGLALSASGALSGVPVQDGDFAFTVRISDSSRIPRSLSVDASVTVSKRLGVVVERLPDAWEGEDYDAQLQAENGSGGETWSLAGGALPPGLSLTPSGAITGSPAQSGNFGFSVEVRGSGVDAQTRSSVFSILVTPGISLADSAIPTAVVGKPYSVDLRFVGGLAPLGVSVSTQEGEGLPPGLVQEAEGSTVITGSATEAGQFVSTLVVADSGRPSRSRTLEVPFEVADLLAFDSAMPHDASTGQPYQWTPFVIGGLGDRTFRLASGRLPVGLQLDVRTGEISGVPGVPGPASFTLEVKDSSTPPQSATLDVGFAVVQPMVVVADLPEGTVGEAYDASVTVSGGSGAVEFAPTMISDGLSLSVDGRITGVPTAAGTFQAMLFAVDPANPAASVLAEITLIVRDPLTLASATLPATVTGQLLAAQLTAAGGKPPYAYALTNGTTLPQGVNLEPGGRIFGVPAVSGAFNVQVAVTDSATPPRAAQAGVVVEVNLPLVLSPAALPAATTGVAYNHLLARTGGKPGTVAFSAQDLGAGLSLAANGRITGTPTVSGDLVFTAGATDGASPAQSTSREYRLQVRDPVSFDDVTLPQAVAGAPVRVTLTATGGLPPYVFAPVASGGALPAGLVLSPEGVLTGTLGAGSYAFDVQASDAAQPARTDSGRITLQVNEALAFDTSAPADGRIPDFERGESVDLTLAATGGVPPYAFSVVSGALPRGLTLDPDGRLHGIASVTGPYAFRVELRDSSEPPQVVHRDFAPAVFDTLAIGTTALPAGAAGVPYSALLTASGAAGAVSWSLSSGTLPSGLTLGSSGLLSGTPTEAGVFADLLVRVDVDGPESDSAERVLSLTILPTLRIDTAALPELTVGEPMEPFALVATGGNDSGFEWTDALEPFPGLSFVDGVLSGTPTRTTDGTSIDFTVRDPASPPQVATRALTLRVDESLTLTSGVLPDGVVEAAYDARLIAAGGRAPYRFQLDDPTQLPDGLVLHPDGRITGTPAATTASTIFDVTVTDAASPERRITAPVSLIVASPLVLLTSGFDDAVTGEAVDATLEADGGTEPLSFEIVAGALPRGLALDADTGAVTGTPSLASNSWFRVRVTDASVPAQLVERDFSFVVAAPLNLGVDGVPGGAEGEAYSGRLTATGGQPPFTFGGTGLPAGITLDPSTGFLTGTPGESGTFAVEFGVTDSAKPARSTSESLSLVVAPTLAATTDSLPATVAGRPYSHTLTATGGAGTRTWSLVSGTLPAGVFLDGATGKLLGTPAETGTFGDLEFRVVAGTGQSSTTGPLSLKVVPQLTIITAALPEVALGEVLAPVALTASGGNGSGFVWVDDPAIHPGLSFEGGALSGTPASAGEFELSFTVEDPAEPVQQVTRTLTLRVFEGLTVATDSLPPAITGRSYAFDLAASSTDVTWRLVSGTLPNGLFLDGTGRILGTPSSAGIANGLVFRATSPSGRFAESPALTLAVQDGLSLATTTLPVFTVGEAIDPAFALVATGGAGALSWNVLDALPAGITFDDGQIAGTPTEATHGTPVRFEVTDAGPPSQTSGRLLTIRVREPLEIPAQTLPYAITGADYEAALLATGGLQPLTWEADGALPAGLSLKADGTLEGVATDAAGIVDVPVRVTDAGNRTVSAVLELELYEPLKLDFVPLPNAKVGVDYDAGLTAEGGADPLTFEVTGGALPPGVSLDPSTGTLSGAPQQAGSFTFEVTATDGESPPQRDARIFSLQVTADPLTPFWGAAVEIGAGLPFQYELLAQGGLPPYVFSLAAFGDSLPAGLSIETDGEGIARQSFIEGAVDSALLDPAPSVHTWRLVVMATDSLVPPLTAMAPLNLTVRRMGFTTPPALAAAQSTHDYSAQIEVAQNIGAVSFEVVAGALPEGLVLSEDGHLSGIVDAFATIGANAFTVRATDAQGQVADREFSILVNGGLRVATASLPTATIGESYGPVALSALGGSGSYSWSVTSPAPPDTVPLPNGLTLSASGELSGTPAADAEGGAVSFTVTDSADPGNPGQRTLMLDVRDALLVASSVASVDGVSGETAIDVTPLVTSGGLAPLTFTLTPSALPAGLSFDSATGRLHGTPTEAAAIAYVIEASDSGDPSLSVDAAFDVNIVEPLLVTTSALPALTTGEAYAAGLAVSGGVPPYVWGLTGDSDPLPTGLTIDGNQIEGTVITASPETWPSLTLSVQDSGPIAQTRTASLTLPMRDPFVVTSGEPDDAAVGSSYAHTFSVTGGIAPLTWSLESGDTFGLSLDTDTGELSGTPDASGFSTLSLKVVDSGVPQMELSFDAFLQVFEPLTVLTASLPMPVAGSPYSTALLATGGLTPYSWSLAPGSDPLPAGLSLNGDGTITGTPSEEETTSPTFLVTDSASPPRTASATLAIESRGELVYAGQPRFDVVVGNGLSSELPISGGRPPFTYTLWGGDTLGLTLEADGTFSGTATTAGFERLTITAIDSGRPAVSVPFNVDLRVSEPLVIATAPLPTPTVGQLEYVVLSAAGGVPPLTWSLEAGSEPLPAGFSLEADGMLVGMATAVETRALSFRVTDSATPSQSTTETLTVSTRDPLQLADAVLPAGNTGDAYAQTLSPTGGLAPYSWSVVSGDLRGLMLNAETGVLSGIPTSAGSGEIEVQVSDSGRPALSSTATFQLTIHSQLVVTTSALPTPTIGEEYSAALAAVGGEPPLLWSLAVGSEPLPTGLSLDVDGSITGSPVFQEFTSPTFEVTDSAAEPQTRRVTLALDTRSALVNVSDLPQSGVVGESYELYLSAMGGLPPLNWELISGNIPGLAFDPVNVAYAGVPTAVAHETLQFKVSDSGTPALELSFDVVVRVAEPLEVETSELPGASVGAAYSTSLAASGGQAPYSWTLAPGSDPLPLGLSLSTAGLLSGTPSSAGVASLVFQVADSAYPSQIETAALQLRVRDELVVTTTALPDGVAGESYSHTFSATGGQAPYAWELTGDLLGLNFDPVTGSLSGTPVAGSSTLSVTVRDSDSPQLDATVSLALNVYPALQALTTVLPEGSAGEGYAAVLSVDGGKPPHSWALSDAGDELPAGLTLATDGTISGTPASSASVTPTFVVTDSSSPVQTLNVPLPLTIRDGLTVVTTTLPDAVAGVAYAHAFTASGGLPPYTWTLVSGDPLGLSLDGNTGALTGTPTIGSTSLGIRVTDSGDPAREASTSVSLDVHPQISIATTQFDTPTVGAFFTATLQASGGVTPYRWSIDPSGAPLPEGLTLSEDGTLSGTPLLAETRMPVFLAEDSAAPPQQVGVPLEVRTRDPLADAGGLLPTGANGRPYSHTFAVSGGIAPYSWSLISGELLGLTLSADGRLEGTPELGESYLVVEVSDSGSPALSLQIGGTLRVQEGIHLTGGRLPDTVVGQDYAIHGIDLNDDTSGGVPPYTTVSALLTGGGVDTGGLVFEADGTVTGIVTDFVGTQQTLSFDVTRQDSGIPVPQQTTANYVLDVYQPLDIDDAQLLVGHDGVRGRSYDNGASLASFLSGGREPYEFTAVGNLDFLDPTVIPPVALGSSGLSLDTTGGVTGFLDSHFSGESMGDHELLWFRAEARDSLDPNPQVIEGLFGIRVWEPMTANDTVLTGARVDEPFSGSLAWFIEGGTGPGTYTFSPMAVLDEFGGETGLTIDADGTVSGTPLGVGHFDVALEVRDGASPQQVLPLWVTIHVGTDVEITTTQAEVPEVAPGDWFSLTLTASGGIQPYWWEIDYAFQLPPIDPCAGNDVGGGDGDGGGDDGGDDGEGDDGGDDEEDGEGGGDEPPPNCDPIDPGPYAFPPNLQLNPITGELSGNIVVPEGRYVIAVRVFDSGGAYTSKTFDLFVSESFGLDVEPDYIAMVRGSYGESVLAPRGGTPPYVVTAESPLPDGLALAEREDGTWALEGIPTALHLGEIELLIEDSSSPAKSLRLFPEVNVLPAVALGAHLDISATGFELTKEMLGEPAGATACDDGVWTLPLAGVGFAEQFQLFGEAVDELLVGVNGVVGIRPDGFGTPDNQEIGTSLDPGGFFAPFWDDLTLCSPEQKVFAEVLGMEPQRILVLQWKDVGFSAESMLPESERARLDFSIVFHETSGTVQFTYGASTNGSGAVLAGADGASATVGIESVDPSMSSPWSHGAPALEPGLVLTWVRDSRLGYRLDDERRVFIGRLASIAGAPGALHHTGAVDTLPLPFDVAFGGTNHDHLSISRAGVVELNDGDTIRVPTTAGTLQSGSSVDPTLLAPFWEAFSAATGEVWSLVRGVSPNRELVVEWNDMAFADDAASSLTFQLVLHEAGSLAEYRYGVLSATNAARASGNAASIGFQAGGDATVLAQGGVLVDGTWPELGSLVFLRPAGGNDAGVNVFFAEDAWIDLVETGLGVSTDDPSVSTSAENPDLSTLDEGWANVSIGFPVELFGTSYSSLTLYSNGFAVPEASRPDAPVMGRTPDSLTDMTRLLMPYTTNLNPAAAGDIRVAHMQRGSVDRFTAHYDHVAIFTSEEIVEGIDSAVSTDRTISFQLSLRSDRNELEFHYGPITEGPGSGSFPEIVLTGAFDVGADLGWLHSFDGASARPGLSLRVQP